MLVLAILYYIPSKTLSADEMEEALSDANDRLDTLFRESSFSNNSSESVNSNTTNSTTSGNR